MNSKTAHEMAEEYLKEIKSTSMLRYLTLFVFFFLLFCFWRKLNFFSCVLLVAVFCLALRFLKAMKVQQFAVLQQVLREDCDAVKYTAIMQEILDNSKQDAAYIHLCYIQGLQSSGRFQEAAAELDKVYIKSADAGIHLLYQNLQFDSHLARKDTEGARTARQDTQQLMSRVKADQRGVIEQNLRVMDSGLALAEERYEDFYDLEARVQEEAVTQLQLVASAFRTGKADLATGDPAGAREHLEDVVAEGGTLYMVTEAEKLLEGTLLPDSNDHDEN